jgi:hypothetical protein
MRSLEPAEVLDQVKHQPVPANWKVFHAQAGYFGENIAAYLLLAFLLSFVVAASAFALLSVPTSLPNFSPLLLIAGVFGAVTIGLVWLATRQFRSLRTVKVQVLVVTPEGFLACTGGRPQDTFAVAFADLDIISLKVLHARYETAFYLQLIYKQHWHPRRYDWRIPPQFRTLDVIAQTIVENHTHYTLEHPNQN